MSKDKEEDPTAYLRDVKYDPKVISTGTYQDIKKAFAYLDKDKSKTISMKEFREELDKIKKELADEGLEVDDVLEMILDQVDSNGDNEVDLQEFVNMMSLAPINDLSLKENTVRIYKEFTRGEKSLDRNTLAKVAESLGENPSEEDLDRMMFFADKDQDGIIDEEEFFNILNSDHEKLTQRAGEWKEEKEKKKDKKKSDGRKVVKRKK